MVLSKRENHVLSSIASFFCIVTASTHTKSGRQDGLPKPLSALQMMTTEDEGWSFFGRSGVFASMLAAGMELCALVGRQAAVIRRLLALLAHWGGAAAPIAIQGAIKPGPGAPPLRLPPQPQPLSSAAAADSAIMNNNEISALEAARFGRDRAGRAGGLYCSPAERLEQVALLTRPRRRQHPGRWRSLRSCLRHSCQLLHAPQQHQW
jgi:hypothetical protein